MRVDFCRLLALFAWTASLYAVGAQFAQAAWSHHPTAVNSNSSTPSTPVGLGGTTTTTTMTIPPGFTGTVVLGPLSPIQTYLASGNGTLGTGTGVFSVQTVTPPTTSTTTTTVSTNQNGSTTTTKTTVVSAATPQQTTTMLTNLPPTSNQTSIQVNVPGFGPTTVSSPVVSFVPQPAVNGVMATNLSVTGTITGPVAVAVLTAAGQHPSSTASVPFSLTETFQTVAIAPVAPQTTTASTTTLPASFIFPRGVFGAAGVSTQPVSDDIEAEVKAASDQAQAAITLCGVETPSCVADALDAYADALEKLAPRLPPRLRTLPAVIRNAAHKIRIAKTPAEAVKAVKAAIAVVHKTISLLRADDPATRQTGTREGTMIAETLQVASAKLQKAVGL